MRRLKWLAGWLSALVLVAVGLLIYSVLPRAILYPGRFERWAVYHNRTPSAMGMKAEDMQVEVQPGLFLHGWHVTTRQSPARGMVVLLHGHSSCKEAMLGLAQLFSERGYNCLLYDSRAHGESGGAYCTFGFYERCDLSRFLDEVERRFGPLGPVAVYGNSLGGSVALQAMPGEPRIRCAIIESPFGNLRDIVHDYLQHYSGISSFFLSNFAVERAGRIAHFDVDAVNPEVAAGSIRQPVLLSHGTDDHWIAFRYGERIAHRLNAPGCVWFPVRGADHGNLWQKGGSEYKRMVLDFLDGHCQ